MQVDVLFYLLIDRRKEQPARKNGCLFVLTTPFVTRNGGLKFFVFTAAVDTGRSVKVYSGHFFHHSTFSAPFFFFLKSHIRLKSLRDN